MRQILYSSAQHTFLKGKQNETTAQQKWQLTSAPVAAAATSSRTVSQATFETTRSMLTKKNNQEKIKMLRTERGMKQTATTKKKLPVKKTTCTFCPFLWLSLPTHFCKTAALCKQFINLQQCINKQTENHPHMFGLIFERCGAPYGSVSIGSSFTFTCKNRQKERCWGACAKQHLLLVN